MELEVTWGRAVRVWWAYLWRNLLAILAMVVAGAGMGFVVGLVLGTLGVPIKTIQGVATVIGGLLGLAISVVPVKLILGKDFGEFRLVLLANGARRRA
ncbi:MAG TPA: hypothetical protein VFE82_04395 [Ramlibacter sp.]|jgi:hypothetical protein|uniref:hypothetical protein n=1 Tax=Ramlibacter sp. TaxID=1917967 RepID=UPI002D450CFF|nr:hypothetical protein [Ramlibacter sp.]HZY17695.1 hypothetical protein [Ramlibacter sp.]